MLTINRLTLKINLNKKGGTTKTGRGGAGGVPKILAYFKFLYLYKKKKR